MNNKIKNYIDKCVEHVLANLVWSALTGIGSIIALNVPLVISKIINAPHLVLIVAIVLSVLSTILLIFAIFVFSKAYRITRTNNSTTKPINTETPTNQNTHHTSNERDNDQSLHNEQNDNPCNLVDQIHFKKITITMIINSCKNIEYIMKFDGHANSDDIECFWKELSWSGTKYITTVLKNCNVEAELQDNLESREIPPYRFNLMFNEEINRGDKIKFTTLTTLTDSTKCMIPVSSFCARYPIDELVMKLTVPTGTVHNVRKKCYQDVAREVLITTSKSVEKEYTADSTTYSFSVTNPTPWMYYALEWKFTDKY